MPLTTYLSTCCVTELTEHEAKQCIAWLQSFCNMSSEENTIPDSITFRVSESYGTDDCAVFADFVSEAQLNEFNSRLFQMSLMFKYGVAVGRREIKHQLQKVIDS